MTMTLISTTTVGSGGAANITISSIPQTYTDIYLVVSGRSTRNGEDQIQIAFNGSSSGYTQRSLYASGSSAASLSGTSLWANAICDASQTANTFSNGDFYIANYTSSLNKTVSMNSISANNASSSSYRFITAGIWANSSAINSFVLTCLNGGNFVENSSVSLYGITKGSGGATVS